MNNMKFNEIKELVNVRFAPMEKQIDAITMDAKYYGFPGLTMYPVIDFGATEDGYVSAKVTEDLIKAWGVTVEEVFKTAIGNLRYTIKSMSEILIGLMVADGMPEELAKEMMEGTPDEMWVVSNADNFHGATSVIAATKELKKQFPEGYIVLPSSIHEVIVIPKGDNDSEELEEMVQQINAGVVSEEDRLSDSIYEF